MLRRSIARPPARQRSRCHALPTLSTILANVGTQARPFCKVLLLDIRCDRLWLSLDANCAGQ